MSIRTAAALSLSALVLSSTASAQTASFNDQQCLGVVSYSLAKTKKADAVGLISNFQMYYFGRMKVGNPSLSMKSAVIDGLEAAKTVDFNPAITYCLDNAKEHVLQLGSINEILVKP